MRDDKVASRQVRWCFGLAAAAGVVIIGILHLPDKHLLAQVSAMICGILSVVLVITLLIGLGALMESPLEITLDPLIPSAERRACWREMRQRPDLTDGEFYQRFCRDSGIPEEILLRLRLLYAEYLAMDKVFPEDRLAKFGPCLGF
jgi:hypothetical protein